MKIGGYGIACEVCSKMSRDECPAGREGCVPRPNKFCAVCQCAYERGVRLCFECEEFPCQTSKAGPIAYEYCLFIAGKAV